MGFNVTKEATTPTFWQPVELHITAQDGRKIIGKVKAKFKRLKREEIEAFLTKYGAIKPTVEQLLEVMEDWGDMDDDNGAMPFSPDNLEKVCSLIPSAA